MPRRFTVSAFDLPWIRSFEVDGFCDLDVDQVLRVAPDMDLRSDQLEQNKQ